MPVVSEEGLLGQARKSQGISRTSANGGRCQSPLSRMEMDHLARKNALKATTAWPNERVGISDRILRRWKRNMSE